MPSSAFAQRPADLPPVRLAVVGSGSLARATCLALSALDSLVGVPFEVTVVARDSDATATICHVARLRAAVAGRSLRCVPNVVDPNDSAAVAGVLDRFRPLGVLVAASTQSPWEAVDRPSAWTRLLRHAGMAAALPFHAQTALAVSRAVRETCPESFVVNACFPDTVNPLLAALGRPVTTGVGNVGILATALQDDLGLPDHSRLHMLAHHLHLSEPADPADEATALLDGLPLGEVTKRLTRHRRADRREVNGLTGLLAAQLMADLSIGTDRDTHLPGVDGLPGGYPVRVSGGSVALRLPANLDPALAVRANQRWAAREGVVVDADRIRFGVPAAEALDPLLPRYAEGFPLDEFADVLADLHSLRERLRRQR